MMNKFLHLPRLLLAALLIALAPQAAVAGQACVDEAPKADSVKNAFNLALTTFKALEASQARVALIARVGKDLSRYNLRYSHLALAWRDHPQGRWVLVHLLNSCGTADSDLYNEGLANFFLDDMHDFEALIVYPSEAVQSRIAARLAQPDIAARFHEPRYNMLAHPFSTKYQNSNQWLLEYITEPLAGMPIADRAAAQGWLRAAGYTPSTLSLSAATRLGARMFRANVAFDDHPNDRRMAGKIDTVTVESVVAFLERRDPKLTKQRIILTRRPG